MSKLFPMLGNELRKARERAKKTQEQLAFDADVDRTYISMLENDKKSPTVEMLFRLCESMDVAASDILRRVERCDLDESSTRLGLRHTFPLWQRAWPWYNLA